jgi:hypothetical protein
MDGRHNGTKIAGHRLLRGQDQQTLFLNLKAQIIDQRIVLLNLGCQIGVTGIKRFHAQFDGRVGHAAQANDVRI